MEAMITGMIDIVAAYMASFARAPYDSRPDNTGLDDGPWLPGQAPRKRPPPKSAAELSDIRARAWATRRAKYGPAGHRGLAWGAYRR